MPLKVKSVEKELATLKELIREEYKKFDAITNKCTDIIDHITDLDFKINSLLEKRLDLVNKKVSIFNVINKFKNFISKKFTLGGYKKEKILILKRSEFHNQLQTSKIEREKSAIKLAELQLKVKEISELNKQPKIVNSFLAKNICQSLIRPKIKSKQNRRLFG